MGIFISPFGERKKAKLFYPQTAKPLLSSAVLLIRTPNEVLSNLSEC